MTALDHIIWATASLDTRPSEIEADLGVRLDAGGTHPDFGTSNLLGDLGDGTYLEVLFPSSPSPPAGSLGWRLSQLERPCLYHWALRVDDLKQVAAAARSAGMRPGGVVSGSRKAPDGTQLTWALMFLDEPELGAAAPFFIDWHDTPHPTTSLRSVGTLLELAVGAPGVGPLNRLLDVIGAPLKAYASDAVAIEAKLRTLTGETIRLCSSPRQSPGIHIAFDGRSQASS